jgi:DNA invertase Pin-like site-specific DNA recombinase
MLLIGYARVSVTTNGGDSLDAQRDAIKAWSDEQGHELLYVRVDDGRSGTLGEEDRAGLADALHDIEGEGRALVVHRLDRLARELHVQEAILAKAWELGANVYSTIEGEILRDDPDDPMRTFVRQVMGAAAQLERGIVVARMQGGRKRRRRQGGYIGGDLPYGYRLEKAQLLPEPEQQLIIKRVKGLRTRNASKWTYQRIADKLNAESISAPAGGRWHAMTVQRISTR